jgi:conflict system pore-forming effector with SLATT domain
VGCACERIASVFRELEAGGLVSAGVAAALAAAASSVSATGKFHVVGQALSLASALAAGLIPALGKEILEAGREENWIQARARFTARVGEYSTPDREDALLHRSDALADVAARNGLTPKIGTRALGDSPQLPPNTMEVGWYIEHRIRNQIDYYSGRQRKHEIAAGRLRHVVLAASTAATIFRVAGVSDQQMFAPWIGAFTTAATAIAAHGMLDRRQQLAASFGAMAITLGRVSARANVLTLEALVTRTEDLLRTEHNAWTTLMLEAASNASRGETKTNVPQG